MKDGSIEYISKKYQVLFTTGDSFVPRFLKSGIFMFDLITKGFPLGKISLLWGKKASGKSYVLLKTIASSQSLCRFCFSANCNCKKKENFRIVYVDVEGAWNTEWAERVGVDTKKVYVYCPKSAEEAIDVINEIIKEKAADLICLDSVSSLEPLEEEKKLAAEWTQGLMARLMGKAVRKWLSSLASVYVAGEIGPTLLLVNQSRYKIGYISSEVMPGGLALGFACSLEVKFWTDKPKMEDKKPEWVTVMFEVEKSRYGAPHLSGSFKIVVLDDVITGKKSGDVYEEEDVLAFAMRIGLVSNTKGGYVIEGIDKKFKTQDEIIDYFIDNKDVFIKIKEMLLEKGTALL